MKPNRPLLLLFLLSVAASVSLSACFNPFNPLKATTRTISEPPPRPTSPRNAMLLFEWCWENRSIGEYEELFTDDFRFNFATTDTSGTSYLDRGFTREDELESARHLFLGGEASQPPAHRITMDLDPNLVALPDSRPGKTFPWHVEIFTRVVLSIDIGESSDRIAGSARFFLVRGDSAIIPEDLAERGIGPDQNRWYIERYEEEDSGAPAPFDRLGSRRVEAVREPDRWRASLPAAASPIVPPTAVAGSFTTIGSLKARYR